MAAEQQQRQEQKQEQEFRDEDFDLPLFRTDGLWYTNAYDVLSRFACRLKQINMAQGLRMLAAESSLPYDICERIGQVPDDHATGLQRHGLAIKLSAYILSVLQARMNYLQTRHPECVHSADPYRNVINYFRALHGPAFLEQLNRAPDAYLLSNVLPWLGLTDWNSSSGSMGGLQGGRTVQMTKFKSKLRKCLIQRDQSIGLKRSASAAAASALPASALPASASVAFALSPRSLRVKRAEHFGFKLSKGDDKKGGKRLNSRKLRKRKSKRTCKRRH
jgi:hypothetical protein